MGDAWVHWWLVEVEVTVDFVLQFLVHLLFCFFFYGWVGERLSCSRAFMPKLAWPRDNGTDRGVQIEKRP